MSGIPGFVTGGAVGFAKEWAAGAHAMWWGGAGTPTFLLGKGSPAQHSSVWSPCLSPTSVSRPLSQASAPVLSLLSTLLRFGSNVTSERTLIITLPETAPAPLSLDLVFPE